MTHLLQPAAEWGDARGTSASRVAFVALGAFTFILLLAPQAEWPALASWRIALVAAGAAILALWAARLAAGRQILSVPRGTWPALALGVWSLITVPLSSWPTGSLDLFLDLYIKSLVVLWLIPQVVDTPERLRRLIAWMCLLGVVLGATAIVHFVNGDYETTEGNVRRIQGYDAPLTGNPNDLALTLNMLLPLTASLWAIYRRPVVRAALASVIVLQVAAVIATFSRAGFITLAIVWMGHALRSLRGLKRALVPLALACTLGAVAVLPSGYADHLSTSIDIQADTTGSAQARWSEVVVAADAVWSQPLIGQGLGMNVLAVTDVLTGDWRSVHDVYLQYLADLGVPGLVLFLVLVVGCVRAARVVGQASTGSDLRHLARGIELSLWAFVIEATFHPAGYHFYIYYLGGLALAARLIHEREAA